MHKGQDGPKHNFEPHHPGTSVKDQPDQANRQLRGEGAAHSSKTEHTPISNKKVRG